MNFLTDLNFDNLDFTASLRDLAILDIPQKKIRILFDMNSFLSYLIILFVCYGQEGGMNKSVGAAKSFVFA